MTRKIMLLMIAVLLTGYSCSDNTLTNQNAKKMLVLGIDGMDYAIVSELMDQGKLPTFKKLSQSGSFRKLFSSIPPQSPVAWSNFITGQDQAGHEIFDFIHRDSKTLIPYLSTTKTEQPEKFFSIGNWSIPLNSGKVELLRKGKAFWKILEENNIPSTIIKIPSNFPPVDSKSKTLSGMGTPDVLGTYGEFSFFTNDPEFINNDDISGGKVIPVDVENGMISTRLSGPANIFKKDQSSTTIPYTIFVDEKNETVRIDIQDKKIILNKGAFSDWIELEFEIIPYLSSIKTICKFMVTGISPFFKLYVTPLNISPQSPAMPISTPGNFSSEIADEIGYFYTQGMAEDTKAYEYDILNLEEFLTQSEAVLEERSRMFNYILDDWDSGLLFFYFSSIDQNTHMLWWQRDPQSALYSKDAFEQYGDLVAGLYIEMDRILSEALNKIDDDIPMLVMSDHGFAPYYKKFHLNTWLEQEGYLDTFRKWDTGQDRFFATVNWNKTKAYSLGLNSLFINSAGREFAGTVSGSEKIALMNEIKEKLLNVTDPDNGEKVVKSVYIVEEMFPGIEQENAPDIIVGYARGYRCSDKSALGELTTDILEVNTDKWSGDHCMAYDEVPGIIISNKKILKEQIFLYDLMPTILKEYELDTAEEIIGKPIY